MDFHSTVAHHRRSSRDEGWCDYGGSAGAVRPQRARSGFVERHEPHGGSPEGCREGIKAKRAESSEKGKKLQALSDKLLTPPIRYSQPALQTHVMYLYGMENRTDQKIGKDAVERYQYLRKQIDEAMAELDSALKM